ncbi:MAG: Scr1 family TA system antitoxin-like transcriptional regulator, partial [Thermocrispum sp.]
MLDKARSSLARIERVETEASRVQEFCVLDIPGLLQTEEYYRCRLTAATRRRTREQISNQIEVRRIRQRRLTDDEHPLLLDVVVDESALHRVVGGPEVMATQLQRLAEASTLAAGVDHADRADRRAILPREAISVTVDLSALTWRKSSFSGSEGDNDACVEVAAQPDGQIAVRNST